MVQSLLTVLYTIWLFPIGADAHKMAKVLSGALTEFSWNFTCYDACARALSRRLKSMYKLVLARVPRLDVSLRTSKFRQGTAEPSSQSKAVL